MKLIDWIACTAGLGAGLVAAWLSVVVSARLGDGGFWRQLAVVSRLLLSAEEESHLFQEYLRFWRVAVGFIAKKLAVTLVGLAPIVLALVCVTWLAGSIGKMGPRTDWELGFVVAVCVAAVPGMLLVKYRL